MWAQVCVRSSFPWPCSCSRPQTGNTVPTALPALRSFGRVAWMRLKGQEVELQRCGGRGSASPWLWPQAERRELQEPEASSSASTAHPVPAVPPSAAFTPKSRLWQLQHHAGLPGEYPEHTRHALGWDQCCRANVPQLLHNSPTAEGSGTVLAPTSLCLNEFAQHKSVSLPGFRSVWIPLPILRILGS